MIQLEVRGAENLMAALGNGRKRIHGELLKAVRASARRIDKAAKLNLSNKSLKVRSGSLRSSIRADIDAARLEGTVGTNIVYAKIHEYGGTTKPHRIEPRNAKALRFATAMSIKTKKATRYAFVQFVNHPGSRIPARPWLRPAYEGELDAIVGEFQQALRRTIQL